MAQTVTTKSNRVRQSLKKGLCQLLWSAKNFFVVKHVIDLTSQMFKR